MRKFEISLGYAYAKCKLRFSIMLIICLILNRRRVSIEPIEFNPYSNNTFERFMVRLSYMLSI